MRGSFHKAGRERRTQDARALFLSNTAEERDDHSVNMPSTALAHAHAPRMCFPENENENAVTLRHGCAVVNP
jgi:hypothetical protein